MMDEVVKALEGLQEWLIVVGVGVVVGVIQHFGTKAQKKKVEETKETVEAINTSISEKNGGSSVKDALNRIEDGNRWLDARFDRVVDIVERQSIELTRVSTALDSHLKEHEHGTGN